MAHSALSGFNGKILQRILVVDDDPAILRLVRDKLDRAGFEVFTANSGDKP